MESRENNKILNNSLIMIKYGEKNYQLKHDAVMTSLWFKYQIDILEAFTRS